MCLQRRLLSQRCNGPERASEPDLYELFYIATAVDVCETVHH
jgi:hypothetical protein